MIDKFEPTIEDLGRVADRLTGHGIAGLVPEDWPTLVAAMEDYIAIRRNVADWDNKVERAVRSTSEITRLTAALSAAEAERDRLRVALRPFADYAAPIRLGILRSSVISIGSPMARPQLTMGHCYDARAALHNQQSENRDPNWMDSQFSER